MAVKDMSAYISGFVGKEKKSLFSGLFIVLVVLGVYANSLGNGFVWDDTSVIVTNPALRGAAGSLFHTLDNAGVQQVPYYRPLTLLTFLIEERVHGLAPVLMHFLNILLHAANALLVYGLARSLFEDSVSPVLAGLLFAVHPINAESVNFISGGRNTMLACFFSLLAYLSHLRGVTSRNNALVLTGSVLFLAGLYSKETALMILPVIAAFELPNLLPGGDSRRLQAVGRLVPYAVGTLIFLAMRRMTLADHGIHIDILSGLGARLLDNLYIIPRYFLSVLAPPLLSARYVIPEAHKFPFLPLLTAWLCIIAILGWLLIRDRSKATLFGLGWFVIFWLPVSGIVPFPSVPLADRYFYFPAVGLSIVVSGQAVRWLPSGTKARQYGFVVTAIVLLVLMSLTVRRSLVWNSDISLFSSLVEQYPGDAYSHGALGTAYLNRQGADDIELAERELTTAITLEPSLPEVLVPLGHVRLNKGDFEGAQYYYSKALAKNPSDTEARLNRAISLESLGRTKEAIADYRLFLTLPEETGMQGARQFAAQKVQELSR
jgi:hypothetical protein